MFQIKELKNPGDLVDTDFITQTSHITVTWKNVFRQHPLLSPVNTYEASLSTFRGGKWHFKLFNFYIFKQVALRLFVFPEILSQ